MDPRVFIGTMAVGYDYLLFTSMGGVFLIAVALGYLLRSKKHG